MANYHPGPPAQLLGLLDDVQELLHDVLELLAQAPELPDELVHPVHELHGSVDERFGELIGHVGGGDFDQLLEEHGLVPGLELEFKLSGYFAAVGAYRAWLENYGGVPPGNAENDIDENGRPWWQRWARRVRKPLGWANVVLRSLSAIPGGGAAEEIKSGVERAVSDLEA